MGGDNSLALRSLSLERDGQRTRWFGNADDAFNIVFLDGGVRSFDQGGKLAPFVDDGGASALQRLCSSAKANKRTEILRGRSLPPRSLSAAAIYFAHNPYSLK